MGKEKRFGGKGGYQGRGKVSVGEGWKGWRGGAVKGVDGIEGCQMGKMNGVLSFFLKYFYLINYFNIFLIP